MNEGKIFSNGNDCCNFFGVMSQHFFHNFVGNNMITVGIFGFIDSALRWVNISDGSSLGPGKTFDFQIECLSFFDLWTLRKNQRLTKARLTHHTNDFPRSLQQWF